MFDPFRDRFTVSDGANPTHLPQILEKDVRERGQAFHLGPFLGFSGSSAML